jgi:hypothetical protein
MLHMRKTTLSLLVLFTALTLNAAEVAPTPSPPAASLKDTAPDERDRQVLEAVMLHLLADRGFDMAQPRRYGTIVLHSRIPEKTGYLKSDQIHAEIRDRTLPAGVEDDLRRRNTPADAKPDKYDSVTASYENLTFAKGIVVTNLTEIWKDKLSLMAFEQAYPKALGWLAAHLPGYSEDGTHAVVRAGVGPSPHGAMLTAVLEKRDEKWTVVWYYIARFV